MDLKIADLRFEVLDAYMAAATALYGEVVKMRSAGAGAAPRTGAACLNPGLAAASAKSWVEAATSRTGAGTVGPAVGGLRHPRLRRKKLKEVAPW